MQELIVIAIVVIAILFVARKIYQQFFAKETKCEGCAMSQLNTEDRAR